MRFKLYWLHKLRAFKSRAFLKKNRSIAAVASNYNVSKGNAIRNPSMRVAQDNGHIKISSFRDAASSFEKTRIKHHHKPSSKLSQVVASLGCGSTVPLRLKKARHKPKVDNEEEAKLQAPPRLAPFSKKAAQHVEHVEDNICKERCLDPHATTKTLVGACQCIQNPATGDKGSTRSDEALLSRKLRKELRVHGEGQGKPRDIVPTEAKPQKKGLVGKTSVAQNAVFVKEPHLVSESKPRHAVTKVEGWMSDRVVHSNKSVDTEAKVLQRWSSASVRDYMNLRGNSTALGGAMSERSIGPITRSRDRSLRTSYDERFHNAYFERRLPQSMTSFSNLSSYDFDRASYDWGSFDAANVGNSLNTTYTGHSNWQGDIMEESNVPHHRNTARRLAFSTRDSDASVTTYTLSDCEDYEEEEEQGLLNTVSYAKAWLNHNVCADNFEENDGDDDDEEEDDEYADCFIDLEANAKAWATAWALSSIDATHRNGHSYSGSSPMKRDYANPTINSHKSQRELDAAALKRKYHKEYAGKQQAIVVSSHYEDDMNTFMFPSMSDHEDGLISTNSLKRFNNSFTAKSSLNKVDQEGFMVENTKKVLSGDHYKGRRRGYHSLVVEKKSKNPYADFRDSMVDMVLQKQMYKSSELEELLQSFLCLNSLEHHDLIVQAFSEVWEKVFGSINGFYKRA